MRKIRGELGEYYVSWKEYGWTYAQVVLRKGTGFKLFDWELKEVVWETCGKEKPTPDQVRHMHKNEYLKWVESAVKEYEDYLKSWRKEN